MGICRIQSWEYAGYSHGNRQDIAMGIGRSGIDIEGIQK
jgi:hypothetical protein